MAVSSIAAANAASAVASLTPTQREAALKIAGFIRNQASEDPTSSGAQQLAIAAARRQSIVEWGEQNYYIPVDDTPGVKSKLIRFLPHQRVILGLFFDEHAARELGCQPSFQTLVFSTVKKSGKTAIAGLVARWIAETWGQFAEVYCMANDLEQARGRIYEAALKSIMLDPRFEIKAKGIPDLWRIVEREAQFLPTASVMKAVSSDYKGEAGSNPVVTLWSELWGYSTEASQRLWEELTPVPTRPRSVRYVETYAGYEGESSILNELEDRVKTKENRLTYDQLRDLGYYWPEEWREQPLPFFVHAASRTMAYWDEGESARRMPWQTPAYYQAQEAELRTNAFRRLHLNFRVSNVEEFIPIEWWDRLNRATELPPGDMTPLVVAADAAVTSDCMTLQAVSRVKGAPNNVAQRLSRIWTPRGGTPLNYSLTIEPTLRQWCTGHIHPLDQACDSHHLVDKLGPCVPVKPYNVVEVAYDQYQLHDLMTRIRDEGIAWTRPFSQNAERSIADKQFFDLIRDMRFEHLHDQETRQHIQNCAAKVPKDDNTRLRLIKKAQASKIDGAVALSMASNECLRLSL